MAYLSANDSAILADLADGVGGFSVGPPIPYDPIGMAWANGRRCTDTPDPGPVIIPDLVWRDGTPQPPFPHPPTALEWRRLVSAHGLPMTRGGKVVGVGWSDEMRAEAVLNAAKVTKES